MKRRTVPETKGPALTWLALKFLRPCGGESRWRRKTTGADTTKEPEPEPPKPALS